MIRFNANLYRLAFSCGSNEETRYYLKGVFVEPHAHGGVTLTATDGHRLLCIHDVDGHADESAIINLGDGLKACKPKRNERRDVVIATGSKDAIVNVTVEVPDRDEKTNAPTGTTTLEDTPVATAYGVRVDGTYPSYRQVVPQAFTNEGAPGFQGRYISAFGDLACELAIHADRKPTKYASEESRADVLRVFCGDGKNPEGSPALVIFPAFDFVFGILMPCRVKNDSKPSVPLWFRATAPVAQAAE
jgi:hypothetical protein